jgi:hypothetical protein
MDTETRLACRREPESTRRVWRAVLIPFVVSRVFSDGLVAFMVGVSGHRIVSQGFALFDGRWYLAIARGGYPSLVGHHGQTSWAFFPLFPAAVHILGTLGLPGWVAGVIISHVAFYVGLAGLYRLVARRCSPTAALLAVWSLALFPAAFVFSLVYPSSLFLPASVWAFVFATNTVTSLRASSPRLRHSAAQTDSWSPSRSRSRSGTPHRESYSSLAHHSSR